MTESALLIALASVLSIFAVFKLPSGGSITIGSMIPIILLSLKYPFRWSLAAAFVYSLIQMMLGFYAPPVQTMLNYVLVTLLDYVLAFSVLCLSGPIFRALGQTWPTPLRLMAATAICFMFRFMCHFFSGMLIWAAYAPPDQPLWLYSLLYNGSYMLGEAVVSGFILFVAGQKLIHLFIGD